MNKKLLAIGGILVILGVLSFALHPVLDPAPDSECSDGSEYSYSEQSCASGDPEAEVSEEEFNEARDYATKPKIFRIIGVVLVLAGIVVAALSLFIGRRNGMHRPRDLSGPPQGVPPAPD